MITAIILVLTVKKEPQMDLISLCVGMSIQMNVCLGYIKTYIGRIKL